MQLNASSSESQAPQCSATVLQVGAGNWVVGAGNWVGVIRACANVRVPSWMTVDVFDRPQSVSVAANALHRNERELIFRRSLYLLQVSESQYCRNQRK